MRSTDWERRINRSVDTISTLAPECLTRAEVLTPNLTLGGELVGRDGGVIEHQISSRKAEFGRNSAYCSHRER